MIVLTNCEGRSGIEVARRVLLGGGSALDAVEHGILPVEADPLVDSVGRGGQPNLLGDVVCDAAIMDGSSLMAGSVGALQGYLHAISVARAVMERLPHVMLTGAGVCRFAAEIGAKPAEMLTPEARAKHKAWLQEHVPADVLDRWPDVALAPWAWESGQDYGKGTVIFLVRDGRGNVAAGTSTSGWAQSYPGRLGDTPIIGAGLYADNRYGACACTHTGEMTIRAATARSVVQYMKTGSTVREACLEALRDLDQLRGGQLGAVVVHALDFYGNYCVAATHDLKEKSTFYVWSEEMREVKQQSAEVPVRSAVGD